MTEKRRAWVYRVLTAVIPLATAYGVVDDNKAALILTLAAALFGTGLAVKNTTTKGD